MVVLGAALAVAAVVRYADPGAQLFSQRCHPYVAVFCGARYGGRAGWVSPTALTISLLGVVLAAGVLLSARRTRSE